MIYSTERDRERDRARERDRDVNKFRFKKHTQHQFWHLILELNSPWSFSFPQSNHSWNLYLTCSLTRNKFIAMTHRYFFLPLLCNAWPDRRHESAHFLAVHASQANLFASSPVLFNCGTSIWAEFKVKNCNYIPSKQPFIISFEKQNINIFHGIAMWCLKINII